MKWRISKTNKPDDNIKILFLVYPKQFNIKNLIAIRNLKFVNRINGNRNLKIWLQCAAEQYEWEPDFSNQNQDKNSIYISGQFIVPNAALNQNLPQANVWLIAVGKFARTSIETW